MGNRFICIFIWYHLKQFCFSPTEICPKWVWLRFVKFWVTLRRSFLSCISQVEGGEGKHRQCPVYLYPEWWESSLEHNPLEARTFHLQMRGKTVRQKSRLQKYEIPTRVSAAIFNLDGLQTQKLYVKVKGEYFAIAYTFIE